MQFEIQCWTRCRYTGFCVSNRIGNYLLPRSRKSILANPDRRIIEIYRWHRYLNNEYFWSWRPSSVFVVHGLLLDTVYATVDCTYRFTYVNLHMNRLHLVQPSWKSSSSKECVRTYQLGSATNAYNFSNPRFAFMLSKRSYNYLHGGDCSALAMASSFSRRFA